MISNADKLDVIEQDLKVLHRQYRHAHVIRKARIEKQIAVMTAIANDYRTRIKQGPLFEERS